MKINVRSNIFLFLLFFYLTTSYSQVSLNSYPSTDIYELQNAMGSNANYFTLTSYIDSLVNNGLINDTSEDGDIARYNKWDWFWGGRVFKFQ